MNTPSMPNRNSKPNGGPYTPLHSTSSSSSRWSSHSASSTDSSRFWRTPPKALKQNTHSWNTLRLSLWSRVCKHTSPRRIAFFLTAIAFIVVLCIPAATTHTADVTSLTAYQPTRPYMPATTGQKGPDPVKWLEQNSDNKYAVSTGFHLPSLGWNTRPRAALISLVRNSELEGMMQSMRQLELRWNSKYQYPWVFFNDEPFTEEFKAATRNLTSAKCYYEIVPKEHWTLPDWIDEGRFMNSLEYLGTIGVGKGWLVSYHHMCRWNSGFFYKHPFLRDYDFYWRVEPDVHYFCDIDYDVFRFMRDNKLKYGFNMNILDDARSFPSLWTRTRNFAAAHPHLIHPEADLDWLLDPTSGGEYNNCQFFSNFEIGSLDFWRGEENEAYFEWLDKAGGFYYERFGDAPVHTLSVAMFLPKSEIWFFRDIGYQHDINHHCPPHREGKCSCQPTSVDANFYKLVPLESPQKKPSDTCIRQFLGGDWLKKKEGWSMVGEKAFGGDGYHGYELSGDE
ncbi:Alpha-1,2 mannosyltransferase KTR1 [Lachnellula suecica]|uniref:Alpha-1,2 mannosyltransferase KTR1 n=1 Tax=Lachnellula suecica TaxID=602035 RepID=A0A8T9CPI9_9HELO|nr:Alpha-1,2 mannosyltransferase KTR1 [Lachnellula suecica]